jgi:hypothetical protein
MFSSVKSAKYTFLPMYTFLKKCKLNFQEIKLHFSEKSVG